MSRYVLQLLATAVIGLLSAFALDWASVSASGPCQFQKADAPLNVALCETFDAPAGNPATRSGDLDPILWGVSRIGGGVNVTQGQFNEFGPAPLEGCGATLTVAPPGDVRICGGRLLEAIDDQGSQAALAVYPKQPFDIAGRTGTVTFDVSADSEGPHAAWPEFWWTDQPVPAPHGPLASHQAIARNAFGFSIAGCSGAETGIDSISIVRNYEHSFVDFERGECVRKGSVAGALNHFEVRISANSVEVWGADAGSTQLLRLASAQTAMPLTRGLIWGVDVHYNGCKSDNQCKHTFAWDNLGFDGPTPYRDLSFDVQDSYSPESNSLGWGLPLKVPVNGVYWDQPPTGAIVTLNWFPWEPAVPDVRVNGGPWHSSNWVGSDAFAWRTIAVPIPLAEIKAGVNTIEMRSSDQNTLVSNINLILIAGAPVPHGGLAPSSASSLTGSVPGRGQAGLLVLVAESTTSGIVGSLESAGCRAPTLAVVNESRWAAFVSGAPARVNERFPSTLPSNTPFFVRCAP